MESFKLNNKAFQLKDIPDLNLDERQYSDFEARTLKLIQDWLSGQKSFIFQTSGSTGKPKSIEFSREQIMASAQRTLHTFSLSTGDTILCCLNTEFVAGFMMLIRAFEGGLKLEIIEPDSNPLGTIEDQHIDFVAMTPIQAQGGLVKNAKKFSQIHTLLLGGAGVHTQLEESLSRQKSKVFHSFAMTETLTHVAIRNISKKEKVYHALPGVTFGQATDKCLIIHDHLLKIHDLKTNDIVELESDQKFKWIGRIDNIVNSGGIKIQLEDLEAEIGRLISELGVENKICVVSKPDKRLTNKLILLVEGKNIDFDPKDLLAKLKNALPAYHDPKVIKVVPNLFQTITGKMDHLKNVNVYL